MASLTPASPSLSSTWSSSARPATRTSGFGIRSVRGRMRTPRPAARTMALVGGLIDISGNSRTVVQGAPGGADHITAIGGGAATVDAITVRRDNCATGAAVRLARSDLGVQRRVTPGRLFLLVALLEEIDTDLIAVDPGQLAAAVGQAGRRQQQEEFLQMQALDGSFNRELGASLGNVFHRAFAPPGSVDAHHMRSEAALECDALAPAPFCHHRLAPAPQSRPALPVQGLPQVNARTPNKW